VPVLDELLVPVELDVVVDDDVVIVAVVDGPPVVTVVVPPPEPVGSSESSLHASALAITEAKKK
jgi:hypothetical protein